MNILLDTHIILWAIKNDPKLPVKARDVIDDLRNNIFYSTAAIWEIEIKHNARPDKIKISGEELSELCRKAGYKMVPIMDGHVKVLSGHRRPADAPAHNDPFDRIMLAQAKSEGFSFLTHDSLISQYNEACIISV